MIKRKLIEDLKKAVEQLGFDGDDIEIYSQQNLLFGDYSTNIALQLAKQKLENGKQSPVEIAKEILQKLGNPDYLEKTDIAGPGFINFFIKPGFLAEDLKEILQDPQNFGKNQIGENQKVQVEFISANPTGPLTLPNGRGGAIGDTLANVLAWSGYQIEREYYINDTGNQIRMLGESVLAEAGKLSKKEEHYQGEYIKELAEKFKDKLDLEPLGLGHLLADYLLRHEIKPAVEKLGVKFNEYTSERALHESGQVEKAAEVLKEKGLAYEKEGALWFKSSQFGDEKDRVLMTSKEGRGRAEPTYFLADIAYHLQVFELGFDKKINVWGADHHGYGARLQGAMKALDLDGRLDIIFMQLVKLYKEGKEVRMSKRTGNFVTLDELLDAVGRDAARFFLLMYDPNSQIDFNLDLAKEQSNKNPVYYVQYAHARMSSIVRKVGELEKPENQKIDFSLLKEKEELILIKQLDEFPGLVEEIARDYQVQKLTAYATSLADSFHQFYEKHRVLGENQDLSAARLSLVEATRAVLANTLNLMGINAPEKM